MNTFDPLKKSKTDYAEIVEKISLSNSPVGIDAQYTHAIIITYLQQISGKNRGSYEDAIIVLHEELVNGVYPFFFLRNWLSGGSSCAKTRCHRGGRFRVASKR